jgi:hypothetical protein
VGSAASLRVATLPKKSTLAQVNRELDAWIAYARELEGEDDSQGPPSFTEMRARIVRELVKAQASSLLHSRARLLSDAEVVSPFWLCFSRC